MTGAVKDKAVNCPLVTALLQRDSAVSLLPGQGMLVELLQACLNKSRIQLPLVQHSVPLPGLAGQGNPSCFPGAASLPLTPVGRGARSFSRVRLSNFLLFPHPLSQRILFLSHLFFKGKPRRKSPALQGLLIAAASECTGLGIYFFFA